MKFNIKKKDEVVILTGDDKGKKGLVIDVDRKKNRVFVEGANLNSRHTKPNAKNPQGGIVKSPGGIHISNVKLVSASKPAKAKATAEKAEKAPAKKKAAAKKAAKKA
jgi:large subunit ribosomal protein L24